MNSRTTKVSAHFKTMSQASVPQGRKGKHRQIVSTILSDLDKLEDGAAIKVPLAELVESKEKVRSALNRATRESGADGGNRQRRQLPVHLERQRIPREPRSSDRLR